jgi:hypothetical protein
VLERALRERLNLVAPPAAGDRVFAKSADGKFYVADVVSISGAGVGALIGSILTALVMR